MSPIRTPVASAGETFINVDHPDYGGDIQAAINAHTAGTIFIPAGSARVQSANITYPENISFLGEGSQASVLSWPTDLGAGYAFGPAAAAGSGPYHNNTIEGIGFRGESYGLSLTMGTQATTQDGLRIARRTTVRRCEIRGFGRGLAFSEDHASVYDSDINGNHWNLVWSPCPVSRFGNIVAEDLRIDYASMANIYVEDNNKITDSQLRRISGGLAPYGILAASGRVFTDFIVNSLLEQVNIEGYGNAQIYSDSTEDKISNCQILYCNPAISATYRLPATTYDYCIRVGQITGSVVDMSTLIPLTAVPTIAPIYANNSSVGFGDTVFKDVNTDLLDFSQTNTLPIWKSAATTPIDCAFTTNRNARGVLIRAAAAITQYDLCRLDTVNVGQPFSSSTQMPLGVARVAAASGAMCPIITEGPARAHADATGVAQAKFIKPSATTGRVAEATGFADGPLLGISMAPAAADATFQVHMRLGGWDGK